MLVGKSHASKGQGMIHAIWTWRLCQADWLLAGASGMSTEKTQHLVKVTDHRVMILLTFER